MKKLRKPFVILYCVGLLFALIGLEGEPLLARLFIPIGPALLGLPFWFLMEYLTEKLMDTGRARVREQIGTLTDMLIDTGLIDTGKLRFRELTDEEKKELHREFSDPLYSFLPWNIFHNDD